MTKQTNLEVKLIGEDGNIFNLLGTTSRELKRNDFTKQAYTLCHEVSRHASSYEEALNIIQEYVIMVLFISTYLTRSQLQVEGLLIVFPSNKPKATALSQAMAFI